MTTKKGNTSKDEALEGVSPEIAAQYNDPIEGVLTEEVPGFNQLAGEKVVSGPNNTWIVLGRDRPGSPFSGYSGKMHTQCGTIDMVVGRMSSKAKSKNKKGEPLYADPNFISDAARIYISQKTDIDKNLQLVPGGVGNGDVKSAIGIKADQIRIVAREGIKLVTRTDDENSQGGPIKSTLGIDIIAGNEEHSLQPMVKGENLKQALERLVHHVDKLNGIVMGLVTSQMQFNAAVTAHTHISPFGGAPTTPSPTVISAGMQVMVSQMKDTTRSLLTHKANLQIYKAKYLTPVADCWILSRHNKAN